MTGSPTAIQAGLKTSRPEALNTPTARIVATVRINVAGNSVSDGINAPQFNEATNTHSA